MKDEKHQGIKTHINSIIFHGDGSNVKHCNSVLRIFVQKSLVLLNSYGYEHVNGDMYCIDDNAHSNMAHHSELSYVI